MLTLACWVIFFCVLIFFKINFFQKIISGTLLECLTVLDPDQAKILLPLIGVQTVCKDQQHMLLAGKELKFYFPNARTRYIKISINLLHLLHQINA